MADARSESAVTDALADVDRALHELAADRGCVVVLCHGRIDDDAPRQVLTALRGFSPTPRLDVVLTSRGGTTTGAHALAAVLHELTGSLSVLVPLRARSAGTMLCLGSDELVMTAVAQLGPLDPQLNAATAGSPTVSASDVKSYVALAHDWFGVSAGDGGLELLRLLNQHVFPLSLAQLHRHEALARDVATRLLRRHLPDAPDDRVASIVEKLVTGYSSHEHPILRAEARALGLRVRDAGGREADLLLVVADAVDAFLAAAAHDGAEPALVVRAVAPAPAHHAAHGPREAQARATSHSEVFL